MNPEDIDMLAQRLADCQGVVSRHEAGPYHDTTGNARFCGLSGFIAGWGIGKNRVEQLNRETEYVPGKGR